MLEDASNRELLDAWRAGNERAATVLVRRYMARLTSLASSRLSRKLARRVDAEDVVLSAWRSFFVATGRDQVDVPDDDNLWPLLVTMTLRKLSRQAARHTAERRSIHAEERPSDGRNWPAIVSQDPTPAEAAMVTDEIENVMAGLAPVDREILTKRLQGEQHVAIAEAVGCSERTVRRSLQRVREHLTAAGHHEDARTSPLERDSDYFSGAFSTTSEVDGSSASISAGSAQLAEERPIHETPTVQFSDVVLERLVGQGAFGKVYQATRCSDGATVAVKYLRKAFWKNDSAADQLIQEVSIVSKLSHPGIIQHIGWGKARRGGVFAMMEWVDGEDLESWRQASRPTLAEVVECGVAVCEALSVAHLTGVVHADLTPRNIIRRHAGTFVLTDFGFSRLLNDPSKRVAAGTPGFLAPEQLCDVFGTVSARTDIFGLGGVLYFLLTGQPPLSGRDVGEIFSRTLLSGCVPDVCVSVRDCPEELGNLISRCLNTETADRPDTIVTVSKELSRIHAELNLAE